jgi:hypothetical protein
MLNSTRGATHGALLLLLCVFGLAHAQEPASAFGALDAFVGRSFVNQLYTLDVYRERDGLALHFGHAGGARYGRYFIRPGATAGTYVLEETTFPTSPRDRLAYFDAGSLNLESTADDYRHKLRVTVLNDSLQVDAFGAEKRWGRFGAFQQINSNHYRPVTDQALQAAALTNQAHFARVQQEEQEQREREQEQARNTAALYNSLKQANESAAAREAESREALNATLNAAQARAPREPQGHDRAEDNRGSVTPSPVANPVVAQPASAPPSLSPARGKECQMIHPKVNDTFLTSRGEAFGRKHLSDKAAESCRQRTGNAVFSGDITCKSESEFVTSCAILVECAGKMRSPSCSGMAQ